MKPNSDLYLKLQNRTDEAAEEILLEVLQPISEDFKIDSVKSYLEGFEWQVTIEKKSMKGRCLWSTPGKMHLMIMGAIAIGMHPMGEYLTYCMEAARFNVNLTPADYKQYGINQHPLQMLLRVETVKWQQTGITRRDIELQLLREMNLEGNIRWAYAKAIETSRNNGGQND